MNSLNLNTSTAHVYPVAGYDNKTIYYRVWCPIKQDVIAQTPSREAADAALRLNQMPGVDRASV